MTRTMKPKPNRCVAGVKDKAGPIGDVAVADIVTAPVMTEAFLSRES